MLGWVLTAIGAGFICSAAGSRSSEYNTSYRMAQLEYENRMLRITMNNHRSLLRDYDYINKYAKSIGCAGAVGLFYYLADYHDDRFRHLARFLNKVKHVRNDVAHNGEVYNIDKNFIDKLSACKQICIDFDSLPNGYRLRLE